MANKVSRVIANKGNSRVLFCMNGNMVAVTLQSYSISVEINGPLRKLMPWLVP